MIDAVLAGENAEQAANIAKKAKDKLVFTNESGLRGMDFQWINIRLLDGHNFSEGDLLQALGRAGRNTKDTNYKQTVYLERNGLKDSLTQAREKNEFMKNHKLEAIFDKELDAILNEFQLDRIDSYTLDSNQDLTLSLLALSGRYKSLELKSESILFKANQEASYILIKEPIQALIRKAEQAGNLKDAEFLRKSYLRAIDHIESKLSRELGKDKLQTPDALIKQRYEAIKAEAEKELTLIEKGLKDRALKTEASARLLDIKSVNFDKLLKEFKENPEEFDSYTFARAARSIGRGESPATDVAKVLIRLSKNVLPGQAETGLAVKGQTVSVKMADAKSKGVDVEALQSKLEEKKLGKEGVGKKALTYEGKDEQGKSVLYLTARGANLVNSAIALASLSNEDKTKLSAFIAGLGIEIEPADHLTVAFLLQENEWDLDQDVLGLGSLILTEQFRDGISIKEAVEAYQKYGIVGLSDFLISGEFKRAVLKQEKAEEKRENIKEASKAAYANLSAKQSQKLNEAREKLDNKQLKFYQKIGAGFTKAGFTLRNPSLIIAGFSLNQAEKSLQSTYKRMEKAEMKKLVGADQTDLEAASPNLLALHLLTSSTWVEEKAQYRFTQTQAERKNITNILLNYLNEIKEKDKKGEVSSKAFDRLVKKATLTELLKQAQSGGLDSGKNFYDRFVKSFFQQEYDPESKGVKKTKDILGKTKIVIAFLPTVLSKQIGVLVTVLVAKFGLPAWLLTTVGALLAKVGVPAALAGALTFTVGQIIAFAVIGVVSTHLLMKIIPKLMDLTGKVWNRFVANKTSKSVADQVAAKFAKVVLDKKEEAIQESIKMIKQYNPKIKDADARKQAESFAQAPADKFTAKDLDQIVDEVSKATGEEREKVAIIQL